MTTRGREQRPAICSPYVFLHRAALSDVQNCGLPSWAVLFPGHMTSCSSQRRQRRREGGYVVAWHPQTFTSFRFGSEVQDTKLLFSLVVLRQSQGSGCRARHSQQKRAARRARVLSAICQDLRASGKPDPIFWHMLKNFTPSVACFSDHRLVN